MNDIIKQITLESIAIRNQIVDTTQLQIHKSRNSGRDMIGDSLSLSKEETLNIGNLFNGSVEKFNLPMPSMDVHKLSERNLSNFVMVWSVDDVVTELVFENRSKHLDQTKPLEMYLSSSVGNFAVCHLRIFGYICGQGD